MGGNGVLWKGVGLAGSVRWGGGGGGGFKGVGNGVPMEGGV